jgi:hemolysin activation/secretion protein
MTLPNAFTVRRLVLAMASVCCANAVAQTPAVDPGAVLRNIEQSQPVQRAPSVERAPAPATTTDFSIRKLVGVRVDSSLLTDEVQAYWLPSLNKAVSANEISRFKAWVWEQLQASGYLAYVLTKEDKSPDGSVLVIQIKAPVLGKVTVVPLDIMPDDAGSKPYAALVGERFAALFASGAAVDVQGITAQLNAISYDLPVVLEAALRQPDAESIDVAINMRMTPPEPGKLISGLVQANNYGLRAYGREQLLTQLRVNGETPASEVVLTGQLSEGIRYFKGEASAPWVGKRSRGMGWFTLVESKSIDNTASRVRGTTVDFGGGAHTLLNTTRNGTMTSAVELGRRSTDSNLMTGTTLTDRLDHQLRLRLMTQMTPAWTDNYSAELGLHLGHIGIQDPDDTDTRQVAGYYRKLEFNGQLRKTLSEDKKWVGAVRWRSQAAWDNLDGYNQLSLGGVNGIRAYTSADGVGDQGAQISFDLTHQITQHVFVGVLYDAGVIKQNINAVGGSSPASYSLSGAGVQMGGDYGAWSWIATAARGLDKTEPFETAVNEVGLREWRGSVAINYRFN